MDDMNGDRCQHVDIVEEMPRGKEQRIGEIMCLDLREAECEIGLAELARVGGLGDHVRNHALPSGPGQRGLELTLLLGRVRGDHVEDRLVGFRSEDNTSELQPLMRTSYAVFFLKKKNT